MIITEENRHNFQIGAKAERLFEMRKAGINIPELICVKKGFSETKLRNYLNETYDEETKFSVRSSANAEDGSRYSFAGQFETYLNIPLHEVSRYVYKCFDSVNSESLSEYCRKTDNNPADIDLTVIIQIMINSELSGVIFTANPQGILNETVIAAGRGTGNNVVEDKTEITQYFYSLSDDSFYFEKQNDSPVLENKMIREIIEVSKKIAGLFGEYQDIEWAIKDDQLYILQSRPITSLKNCSEPIVLDSSNISESYPGISSPMTISFVEEVYYEVFRSCIRRLTKNDGTAERLDEILRHMTDSADGRIYYRISGWYDVITLLPFSSRIIPIWQEMLGVKDKKVSKSSSKAGIGTKLRVTLSFFQLILSNRRKMKKLNEYFENIYDKYSTCLETVTETKELIAIYNDLKSALVSEWDLTLVNDMYSFIFTGLIKNSLKKENPENYRELTNKYISGISDIESMKPLKLLNKIRSIENEKRVKDDELRSEYLRLYGDRCPLELKLETETCRTNPELLDEKISCAELPVEKEEALPYALKGLKKKYAECAAAGIAMREYSRISRARIYGLVRSIILKIADNLYKDKKIDNIRDVFYLRFEELITSAEADKSELKEIISDRKKKYKMYELLPSYSRIIYAGEVFDKNHTNVNAVDYQTSDNCLQGIPCSSGTAEGEVILVEEITKKTDAEGKIIVAKMTDPGWVFLISQAKGIISEKGSLLSHTAIISRELNKPAVVGVNKVFEILKDGDKVRINGKTGKITIIEKRKADEDNC